jgi:dTDP-4-amino-4,6-dideoxygalactose transaminase
VDFVDIDPKTYNLSVEALELKLKSAEKKGQLPKIVVPVHFAGQPCEMRRIAELAGRYGFRVIEDASHAIGAKYRGEPIGRCEHSDIAVFSFHPVKIITTGEGGMAITNEPSLAREMRVLGAHGITREPKELTVRDAGAWYYEMVELGFNYRMTDIEAALGRSQLKRLDEFVERRRELVERYDSMLAEYPVVRPWRIPEGESAWHLYVIKVAVGGDTPYRRKVFDSLRESGVGVNVHYIPIHLQPYYRSLGFRQGDFPEAEAFYSSALSLPLHPGLGEDEQRHVVSALQRGLG